MGDWDDERKGRYNTDGTQFYPASGSRNTVYGNLERLGEYGYYWSTSTSASTHGYMMYFGKSSLIPAYSVSRFAVMAIRCVRDEAEPGFTLSVSPQSAEIPTVGGSQTVSVTTNDPSWTYAITDDATGASPTWITPGTKTASALQYSVSANHSGAPRTAKITFSTSDGKTATHEITQAEDNPLNGITLGTALDYPAQTYVGAFWKNDQTGERLIRIPVQSGMDGAWMAMVVSNTDTNPPSDVIKPGATWIRLDGKRSNDTKVWQEGLQPDDAETHRLPNDADTWVKGTTETGYIYFRIGLTTTLANGAAPRYGIVRLYYNNYEKYQDIYIRHGHEPDFLMRKEDNNEAGTITTEWGGNAAQPRPDAVKWSPYNITAPEYRTANVTTDYIQVGARGGVEVVYPSQGGAFFQFMGEAGAERRAYHPTRAAAIPKDYGQGYWSALSSTHETCPTGFRRPKDGTTSGDNTAGAISDSEMRQSLYLNPFESAGNVTTASNNSIWGYYADGYFDRREIGSVSSIGSGTNSAVESSTPQAAYVGQLFYNPNNFASLFFPAAGYRYSSLLYGTGSSGYYWSSSAYTATNGWYLYFNQSYVNQANSNRYNAWSVRCVRE